MYTKSSTIQIRHTEKVMLANYSFSVHSNRNKFNSLRPKIVLLLCTEQEPRNNQLSEFSVVVPMQISLKCEEYATIHFYFGE